MNWWIVSEMYLYSVNIDLCTSNYHIQGIDIRSYNKDSCHITSHSQAVLLVGVHWYNLSASPNPTISLMENLCLQVLLLMCFSYINSYLVWAFQWNFAKSSIFALKLLFSVVLWLEFSKILLKFNKFYHQGYIWPGIFWNLGKIHQNSTILYNL